MEYWNHNSAYHALIVDAARFHAGRALDVGCGEGLLVERLAPVSERVHGVDRDPEAVRRALERTATADNVTLEVADFCAMPLGPSCFDLVTFVATLHHMDLVTALRRARAVLRPGGELIVVGLSANKTLSDFAVSACLLPVVRLLSRLRHEAHDVGVAAVPPRENLKEIRDTVQRELPGASVRRGLYYRYVLRWTKPGSPSPAG